MVNLTRNLSIAGMKKIILIGPWTFTVILLVYIIRPNILWSYDTATGRTATRCDVIREDATINIIPSSQRTEKLGLLYNNDTIDPEGLPIENLHNYIPNALMHHSHPLPLSSSIISYMHNPKSGGTTVKGCMRKVSNALQKDKPILVAISTISEVRENLLNNVTRPNDYYMGDAALGICEYVGGRACSYFTIAREPYERMVSHYYFCKEGGSRSPACDNTLEEFTLSLCSIFFRQLTVRVFCKQWQDVYQCQRNPSSIDHLKTDPALRATILNYFLKNLDKIFTVIGLTNEFETSLSIIEHVYGEPFHGLCNTIHSNNGKYENGTDIHGRKGDKKRILAESKERLMQNPDIQKCLFEDVKLYNKMNEIFKLQKMALKMD